MLYPDLATLRDLDVQGVSVPCFVYGTAWKEDATAALTRQALDAGFRAIDTANQRKHYHEAGVGEGLAGWLADGGQRAELFVQTKFTFQRGQDHRLPYDPAAPIGEQVRQSFASSLEHLGLQTLDSLVLHGPWSREGLSAEDWEAWRAMEGLQRAGRVRLLGISNVNAPQLSALCEGAEVAPAFVQHRCYARVGWGAAVRAVCVERSVVYQGFSLLTANRKTWNHRHVAAIARRLRGGGVMVTPAQVLFRYALSLGILPLTGSSDPRHLAQDLASRGLTLTEADRARIAAIEAPSDAR